MRGLQGFFNALSGRGIDRRDDNGETRLFRAVAEGSAGIVKKLLKDGADPNIANHQGISPLHLAAYWGETEITRLLLAHRADPAAATPDGWTPLHAAAIAGGMKSRANVIALLRAAGSADDKADRHGWTAADYMRLWSENADAAAKWQARHACFARTGGKPAAGPATPPAPPPKPEKTKPQKPPEKR